MFKVNNKDTDGVGLVSLLLTLNIFHTFVNFEQVNAGWEVNLGRICHYPLFEIQNNKIISYFTDKNIIYLNHINKKSKE